MYPNLETVRRNSDVDKISDSKLSYLEKNCNQIFVRGPALTKEILEKVNVDIVPKKTYLLGYELKTKTVLFITGLCLLFSLSCSATSLIWFTDAYDNYVLSQLVITTNNDSFTMWKNPTPKLTYRLYLFNYTNVEEYKERFDKKLHVEDIGPYTYEENLVRENVHIINDETITFQERRTYKFRPDLSVGLQSDLVTVPNIPLITGSSMMKNENIFARIGYAATLTGLDQHPFITLPAHDFITGYSDPLYSLSRVLSSFDDVLPPETFSLLASKIGLNPRVITMNTGKNNYNKLGQFEEINGESKLNYFFADVCNSLEGGDGALYPPLQVQQKKPIYFMFPDVCRRLPLVFQNETTILNGKVPAYRYVLPEDIFDSPEEKPENQCYCSSGNQCLKGIFNTSACSFNSPMFASHPHFQRADPKLLEGVTGLDPKKVNSKCFMNVHPVMGFAMSGKSSLQMNILVQKAAGVDQMDIFEDEIMLPIAWLEVELNEETLPQDFKELINFLTFTIKTLKTAIKFGCLLTSLVTLISLILVLKRSSAKSGSCGKSRRLGALIEEN